MSDSPKTESEVAAALNAGRKAAEAAMKNLYNVLKRNKVRDESTQTKKPVDFVRDGHTGDPPAKYRID